MWFLKGTDLREVKPELCDLQEAVAASNPRAAAKWCDVNSSVLLGFYFSSIVTGGPRS